MKTKFVLFSLAGILLSACGGGSGGSTATSLSSTTSQATTFPISAAIKNLVTKGYAANVTLSGKVGTNTVSGSGTSGWSAGVQTQFEGQSAIDAVDNENITAVVNGASPRTVSSITHQYFSKDFAPLGQLDQDGTYYVVTSFSGWPAAAKVGDSGTLASITVYSDASKGSITGKQAFKYSMEADGSNTAILLMSAVQTDNTNKVVLQSDIRYRIATDGSASLVSGHGLTFGPPADSDLTYTAM